VNVKATKHTTTTCAKAKRQSSSTPSVKLREVVTGGDIERGERAMLQGLKRAVAKLQNKQIARAAS
jgi:hypothetical protein